MPHTAGTTITTSRTGAQVTIHRRLAGTVYKGPSGLFTLTPESTALMALEGAATSAVEASGRRLPLEAARSALRLEDFRNVPGPLHVVNPETAENGERLRIEWETEREVGPEPGRGDTITDPDALTPDERAAFREFMADKRTAAQDSARIVRPIAPPVPNAPRPDGK